MTEELPVRSCSSRNLYDLGEGISSDLLLKWEQQSLPPEFALKNTDQYICESTLYHMDGYDNVILYGFIEKCPSNAAKHIRLIASQIR